MPYDEIFAATAGTTGVPTAILEAIAWSESSMNPDADAGLHDGIGLMGLTYATAQRTGYSGSREGLFDPATNIEFAGRYIAQIIADQGGIDPARLYSEYNSGRPDLWQSSDQVSRNVRHFLTNLANQIGYTLPDTWNISDVSAGLQNLLTLNNAGFNVIALIIGSILGWFLLRRYL